MNWAIPMVSAAMYRLGGSEHGNKWFRWLMGVPIALITRNPWYVLTYYLATAVFVYGDDSWVAKIVGRKGARVVHGVAFGLASLHPLYWLWTAVIFYLIFELADRGVMDNKYAEAYRGLLGTLVFVF